MGPNDVNTEGRSVFFFDRYFLEQTQCMSLGPADLPGHVHRDSVNRHGGRLVCAGEYYCRLAADEYPESVLGLLSRLRDLLRAI